MRNIICSLYLIAGAVMDWKTKKISRIYLGTGALFGLLFLTADLRQGEFETEKLLLQLIPGGIFLLYSIVTEEKIGYGDGIFLMILGFCMPYPRLWQVWVIALFLIVFWAGYLWCFRKAGKNKQIPFLPFLWLSDLLLWGIGHG